MVKIIQKNSRIEKIHVSTALLKKITKIYIWWNLSIAYLKCGDLIHCPN